MAQMEIILVSIIKLALAMLVGFICLKTKYITKEQNDGMSKIVVRVTLPLLIISSLTNMKLDYQTLTSSAQVLAAAFCAEMLLFAVGTLMMKASGMKNAKAVMLRCMMCFGNVVFMAFPLVQALYGTEGLLYAAVYEIANDGFLWTLGVWSISGEHENDGKKPSAADNLKRLANPGTIAFIIAFIMMAFRIKIPGIAGEVVTGIGSTTTYLSMFFIGGTLAMVDFRRIYRRVWLYVLVALKMIIIPVMLIFVLKWIGFGSVPAAVVVLQVAMPTSTVLAVLANEHNGDVIYCAEGVFISHLLGLVTLPLVYYLIMQIQMSL